MNTTTTSGQPTKPLTADTIRKMMNAMKEEASLFTPPLVARINYGVKRPNPFAFGIRVTS
jgi:hypothetical protein